MKIFAYYLPQFHRIPENDEWWGEGFTEWVNVKKARPLFSNHAQPKVPLDSNYYDLSNIKTLEWQQNLLDKYKVDGLIFYHYYFNGKKLLEKPAEMLLKNKNIDINFFFCWANHSWCRSWEGSKKILVEQTYGGKQDWEKHFNYLLPFFKDTRYQKRDNKPLLMVFNSTFPEKRAMFEYFNQRCIDNGFDGICIINSVMDNQEEQKVYKDGNNTYTELIHYREPGFAKYTYDRQPSSFFTSVINFTRKKLRSHGFHCIMKYNANKLYRTLFRLHKTNKHAIPGAFFEWDNTPRHSYRGYVITPVSEKMFKKYISIIKDSEYLFINAWNEWAEGMMLEPTEKDGYKYLEWIRSIKQ